MNVGLRISNGDHKIKTTEIISSKMRMERKQEKSNSWPSTVDITVSPHLTSIVGSANLSKTMYKETSFTMG